MLNFLDESFVVAVCFVIFIYLAYKPIKKAIVASLDAKIIEIKNKLAETEKLKKDASDLLAKIEKEMSSFEESKKTFLINAQLSTERLIEMKSKEMDLLLARKKDSAIKSLENESNKASALMQTEFTESIMKLVRRYLNETDNNHMTNEDVIKNLQK